MAQGTFNAVSKPFNEQLFNEGPEAPAVTAQVMSSAAFGPIVIRISPKVTAY